MQLECKRQRQVTDSNNHSRLANWANRFQAVLKYFWSIETVVKDKNKFCALPALMSIAQNIIVYYHNNFPIDKLSMTYDIKGALTFSLNVFISVSSDNKILDSSEITQLS